MVKLEVCKNSPWRGYSEFAKFFTGVSFDYTTNLGLRSNQILIRDYKSSDEVFILRRRLRNWMSEHNIDYSISFVAEGETPNLKVVLVTAYIEFYEPKDAVLFKLTWM